MPGFDRTGPRGLGPRTGRGLGICNRIVNKSLGTKKTKRKRKQH